jgi:hypothetical protein
MYISTTNGSYDSVKDYILKLQQQQFPKYEKIDYPPVNYPSDLARNTS